MQDLLNIWSEWIKPSAGLATVQWSVLLALAAAAGHLVQRYTGLPKVIGYSVVGALAGFAGFTGALWHWKASGFFCWNSAWPWCCLKLAAVFRCAGFATTRWCWCKACSSPG